MTAIPDLAVMEAWHKGRSSYCVWMYRLADPALLHLVDDILAALADLDGILPVRTLHMTVFVSGFASELPVHSDDVATAVLDRQIDAVGRLVLPHAALKITGVSLDRNAIYLRAEDTGPTTATIRTALDGVSREIRFAPYQPHITLAYYLTQMPLDEVDARLQRWKTLAHPLIVAQPHVELVSVCATEPICRGIGLCLDDYRGLHRRALCCALA